MAPAPMVGTPEALVYYSGRTEIFTHHQPALEVLGAARHLGEDTGLAQLMYQAHLDVFLTALSALMHATALMGSAGISATEFIPEVMGTLAGIPTMLNAGEPIGPQIDSGTHPGHLSTTTMMGATADHIVATSKAAGIDTALPEAVKTHYDRAIAGGHGSGNWTSIIEGIRNP